MDCQDLSAVSSEGGIDPETGCPTEQFVCLCHRNCCPCSVHVVVKGLQTSTGAK